jgi:pilus assembly protein FimV
VPSISRHTPSHQAPTHAGGAGSRGLARLHAVAAAVVLCTGLAHFDDAQALALGRIVVQSALGEPLRAEIDVPDINAEEAASLRVGLASGEAFRAAGMDFNPALSSLQISLQRRANGTAFLRLTSTRPVNEPFVDMIVEANWASGRIVRDYTLLLDPPNLRAAAPVAPLPAGITAQPAPQVLPPAARPVAPVAQTQPLPAAAPAPTVRARPVAPTARQVPAAQAEASGGQVRVRTGDTAGRIAAVNRPANVSLDQMLVAMLRANPEAFIGGNVNRIKAGSVIDLPGEAAAATVAPGEARQIIAAQSRDFNEFRRRLAGTVPAASVAAADRQAAGRVQAEVEDTKPAAPTQDKLTLSKAATPTQSAAEEKIAQDRQAQEAATRVAELSKNIEELAKLGTSTAAVAPTTAGGAATGTGLPASVLALPTAAPVSTPTEATAATASLQASATDSVASVTETSATAATETVAATPVTPAAAVPVPAPLPPEPSLIDGLRDNPLVLPAAGGLLALLAGFAFYRFRQRKKGSGVDSSFLESRLQPDSFFGSSGGQRIDTAEASASGSSMVYSPSQLDAAGDVDPVAEADVYLAYGRDLQAEEILKEAMRSTPQRVAIHNKLLEIYAKRRDAKAFEVVATEAYGLTQGQGAEWDHACELGRELDPANPLYQPGGSPPLKAGAVAAAVAGGAVNTMPFGSSTLAQSGGVSGDLKNDLNIDLDLDFSLDEPSAPASLQPSVDSVVSGMDDLNSTDALTRAADAQSGPPSMSMDFDLDFPSEPAALNTPDLVERDAGPALTDQDAPMFDDSEVLPNFDLEEPQPVDLAAGDDDMPQPLPSTAEAASADPELLSFDLNDISLELEGGGAETAEDDGRVVEENPLDTKLSLAEEFRAIGDLEGARSLAEEVLAEASGTLKTKASRFLADLN